MGAAPAGVGRTSLCAPGGALGNRPGPLRGAAFNGWTRRVKGGETRLDGELARACARKNRSQGRRSRRGGTLEGVSVASVFRRSGKQAAAIIKVRLSAFRLPSLSRGETKSPTRAAARGRWRLAV